MGMTKQNGSLTPTRGYLPRRISEMREMADPEMPQIDLIEYDPLLDSSNIGPKEWAAMAQTIGKHYYDYDGFVIIHGTDTLSYTASALSFMLEDLGKVRSRARVPLLNGQHAQARPPPRSSLLDIGRVCL